MASLKIIRKRITSVKSTQKITRAMKMVAGAKLNRAQQRILALRPYAVKTQEVLESVVRVAAGTTEEEASQALHPLLRRRPENRVTYLVITGDRGLCGSFNANLNKTAERLWKQGTAEGKSVTIFVAGRKGRDYLRRRNAPVEIIPGVWEKLDLAQARRLTEMVLKPFKEGTTDAIYLVYSEFKSAMSQEVAVEPLLPVGGAALRSSLAKEGSSLPDRPAEYLYEPDRRALLDRLVPMYLEISILRALYESQASFFGAQMTAMDSATKNAKEMIADLTLQYNRARQAAITKELMEIIGGAEALKE